MDRRDFLKAAALVAGAFCLAGVKIFAQDRNHGRQGTGGSGKILIAYFSKTGNTRSVAEEIHRQVGGDLFHITTVTPYPEGYQEAVDIARKEQSANARQQLASAVSVMNSYSTIYLGYPNWWGTLPMAGFTFLEQYDFTGKAIAPFCTHEGSGFGRGPADIKQLCPQAKVMPGLAIRGGSASEAGRDVAQWLQRIGVR